MRHLSAAAPVLLLLAFIVGTRPAAAAAANAVDFDVVVYGGTAGGVTAAVQAARMGKRAVIVDPSDHLGGMTSGGLGFTDVGNPATVGGIAREFYHHVWQAYRDPAAWRWQAREQFARSVAGQGVRSIDDGAEVQWNFEPHVAERAFDDLVREAGVARVRGRLDLHGGVVKAGGRITGLRMEDGRVVAGRVFVDASYAGDVMALAGVRYVVGREANAEHHETVNGIEAAAAKKNQLPAGIDAFRLPGDRASGLLPLVNPDPGGPDGSADQRVQAYCYRLCLTDVPANRLPIARPDGYDERDFELLLRAVAAGQSGGFLTLDRQVPNHKTDANNGSGISLDLIGGNHGYPDGDYAARARIADAHRRWSLGLIYTLQQSGRVPAKIRAGMLKWGLPKDEFTDNDHFPRELYVREGRRMVGALVECEPLLRDSAPVTDSVAMGSYKADSHNVQRYADAAGHVRNEGDVQASVGGPYRISYRAIVPRADQCANLLVPWCLSATHAAYGSIRMEPVFMSLGQAAGTAAALAIDGHTSVQAVPYDALRDRLRADKQVVELTSVGDVPRSATGGSVRVVCLGDSITRRGYPPRPAELLHVTVANAGVTRMVDQCRSGGVQPVICTIPPIDPAGFFTRHDRATFDAHGGLAGLLASYHDAARGVAAQADEPVVDLTAELPLASDWHTVDGVHPDTDDTRRLAMLVAQRVAPLLNVRVPPDAVTAANR